MDKRGWELFFIYFIYLTLLLELVWPSLQTNNNL